MSYITQKMMHSCIKNIKRMKIKWKINESFRNSLIFKSITAIPIISMVTRLVEQKGIDLISSSVS